MKNFLSALCLTIALMGVTLTGMAAVSPVAAEARFFQNLNDVPLMDGLYELTDDSLVFDKAEGRIVEATAAADRLQPADIKKFYKETLPHLGWRHRDADTFVRDDEVLKVKVKPAGAGSLVHLSLSPRE